MTEKKIKERALHWCAKFLGGAWAECTMDQFIFTQIKGALTNYIYCCEMDSSVIKDDHEYRKVLLRIYGEISGPHEKFCEMLIFNILSERKLGPKLLGAFKDGRIEQYIEATPLTVHHLRSGEYLTQIAAKMAKYHLLEIPFNKKPIFVPRFVSKYLPHLHKIMVSNDHLTPRQKEIVKEIFDMNIIKEYQDLQKILDESNSLNVFCHNDVQESNLLILPVSHPGACSDILLIDFEYSYYGYRGFDIGNHFCEWVLQNSADTPLGFDYDVNCYPSPDQQMEFAQAYIECISSELKTAKESKQKYYQTTPEELIREANLHSLMSHLFWGFWGVAQHYLSHIDFAFLEYSLVRFKLYFYFKQKFLQK